MTRSAEFKQLLKALAKDYYSTILEIENNEILAFGIFTDSDISSFLFAYNTQEGINANIKRAEKNREKYPEFYTSEIDGDIWSLPEWTSGQKKELFNYSDYPKNQRLYEIIDQFYEESINDDRFPEYKNSLFDLFCESLYELKKENTFKNNSVDFLLLVQEGDNGIYDNRVKSLSKILSPLQLKDYLNAQKSF